MKVGIDSYCYHRFFGEVYDQQVKPEKKMTPEDFLKRAKELDVDGVSLESCFIPSFEAGYLANLKSQLDEYKFDRVWAWGHPDGLEGGKNQAMFKDMMAHFDYAKGIGASVMRVCGGSLAFRHENHQDQIKRLTVMFKEAVKKAEDYNIKLAMENHIDFTSDECVQLLAEVNSPFLGLNFDTGNFLRLMDDPIKGMEKLSKHVFATHIKDLKPQKGVSPHEWFFFSCTPVGDGLVDNMALAKLLHQANYAGFLAVEIDFLHPDYNNDEDAAVAKSIKELKRIAAAL